MADRTILWTVTDPRGLLISLASDVWQKILREHFEIGPYFDQVRLTAQDPDEIYFDPETTAKRATGAKAYVYYKRNVTTGKYAKDMVAVAIKVVNEPSGQQGYVSTAMITSRIFKRLVLEWKR